MTGFLLCDEIYVPRLDDRLPILRDILVIDGISWWSFMLKKNMIICNFALCRNNNVILIDLDYISLDIHKRYKYTNDLIQTVHQSKMFLCKH